MFLRSVVKGILLLAASLVLSSCGLLGGNKIPPTSIAVEAKNCYLMPNLPPGTPPQCAPYSDLEITPFVPVWGNYVYPYVDSNGVDQTQGSVVAYGDGGLQPLFTPKYLGLQVPSQWRLRTGIWTS